jgi:hypothetical protein
MFLDGESRCPSGLLALVAKAADLFTAFEVQFDFHTRPHEFVKRALALDSCLTRFS